MWGLPPVLACSAKGSTFTFETTPTKEDEDEVTLEKRRAQVRLASGVRSSVC